MAAKTKAANAKAFVRNTELKHLVGAHVGTSGGVEESVGASFRSGGNAFGLFLKNQRRWTSKPYEQKNIDSFQERCEKFGYDPRKVVLPHGSYLINLGNPEDEKRQKALEGLLDDLQRCEQLNIGLYNLHPGSSLDGDKEEAILKIAQGINRGILETKFVKVVFENMAGQGRIVGSTLEDLRKLIDFIDNKERVGVCIDTCHTFAAGYDISNEAGFEQFWNDFDRLVGYKYLSAIHLNDSKAPLGSNRDLHQNIGLGFLGLEAFRLIMNKKELEGLPMILETPFDNDQDDTRAEETKLLEWLIGKSEDDPEFIAKAKDLADKGAKERKEQQDKFDKKNSSAKSNKKTVQGNAKLAFKKRKIEEL